MKGDIYIFEKDSSGQGWLVKKSEMMPVHTESRKLKDCPKEIPMSMLNENRAQTNHGQTLQRLKRRGGLCVVELLDNIFDRKLSFRNETEQDVCNLNTLIEANIRTHPRIKYNEDIPIGSELEFNVHFKLERGKQIFSTDEQQWKEMSGKEKDECFEKIAIPIKQEQQDELLEDIILTIAAYYNGTKDKHIRFSDVDIYAPELKKKITDKYNLTITRK